MAEIAHCCDHLDVDGFALLTNVDGTYLGDPAFAPVFARARPAPDARVFIHPTSPPCWEHTVARPAPADGRVPVRHHPGRGRPRPHRHDRPPPRTSSVIVPHAGATLPMVADRVSVFSLLLDVDPAVDVLARPRPAPLRPGRLPAPPPARRPADADDARAPPLRQRLPVHPRARRRRLPATASPRPATSSTRLRANTERLFPASRQDHP